MGRTCVGGFLDGMAVFIDEDVHACVNGGGRVVGETGSGGCGATSISEMAPPGQLKMSRQNRGASSLLALRKVRALGAEHAMVQAALSINAIASTEIERIGRDDPDMRRDLVAGLLTVGKVVAAVTADKPENKVYDRKVHNQLASL